MQKNMLHHDNIIAAVQKTVAQCAHDGKKPVCLAICDRQGETVFFLQMQGAVPRASAIAKAKARTSALMECPTRDLHARLVRERLCLADFCNGELSSIAGGIALGGNGDAVGGIGVSGRLPDDDEQVALLLAENLAQGV